jgi:DNA topoisomerase-1
MHRIELLNYFIKQLFKNNDQIGGKNNNKWNTLIHNGVKFPPEYEKKNIPLIYNGKEIILDKYAEECAFLYAKYINTDYVDNNTFNKNFFNDWKKILGKNTEIKLLENCDFSLMKEYLDIQKEKNKEKNKEKDKEDDEKFKIAIVDGKPQEVANFKMEPPGLFIGRGKNPHLGKIKKRIYPEDITLNIDKDAPIPELQLFLKNNHKWGNIIHDKKAEWLASWKDTIIGKTKYLWLSSFSDIRTSEDQKKFDIAKKLKKKIQSIRETNNENLKSDDIKTKQIATALYFIDKLGIRVGNEKGEDTADTVGITNLRIEHIDLSQKNTIELNFLGKDSVPYTGVIESDLIVYQNIENFIKDKTKDEQVFDKINSNDVNKYLQSFMTNLTAKVFRTYNASNLFQKELNKITKKYEGVTGKEKEIMDEFIKANTKVAKLMNHQKNISKGYKNQVEKIILTIDKLKKQLNKTKRSNKKNLTKVKNIKEKIKAYKSKKEIVKEMKNVSLDTSKANYVDPRILVIFMRKNNLDINKIFSKNLQKKFKWAFEVDNDWKF